MEIIIRRDVMENIDSEVPWEVFGVKYRGVFLVSIWLAATPLVGMRTILHDNLFNADGIWSSTAVFTSRVTTVDSPNLILLECNKKRRDAPTLLVGSAHNSSTHRGGLWVPLRENLLKFDVWLTVHRSSMWNKKPTRCHLVLYLFLLYKLLFISYSTCFGPPCAHLQELTT